MTTVGNEPPQSGDSEIVQKLQMSLSVRCANWQAYPKQGLWKHGLRF